MNDQRESTVSPLTQDEQDFADRFDFESCNLGESGMEYPAHNWMKANGVWEREIWSILVLRERERKTVLAVRPDRPFKPAWRSAEEARQRNTELEQTFPHTSWKVLGEQNNDE